MSQQNDSARPDPDTPAPGPRLRDHVAVITGATSGIGEATARLFVIQGARVVLAARSQARGDELVRQLGDRASFVATDVRDGDAVAHLIEVAAERHGRIDSLFNNAGNMGRGASVSALELDDFDDAMQTLVRSVFVATRCVVPIMRRQGSGSIINNASIAGTRAGRGTLLYSTAKAAVIHFTHCVAMELAEYGIRTNSVSPGFIATPMMAGVQSSEQQLPAELMSQVESVLASESPTGAAGLPIDVAELVLFLASPEAQFINGQDIVVDGGASNGLLWRRQHASMTGQTTKESSS